MTISQPKVFSATDAENSGPFMPLDWALFAGVSVVWGASFFFIEIGLGDGQGLAPGVITLMRVGLGALALNAVNRAQGKPFLLPDFEDRMRVVLLAAIWVAVPFTLFPLAQEHVNSAVAGLLNGGTPIFVAVVAAVFLRQRTRGAQLLGIIIGFIGIVAISAPSIDEGSSEALGVGLILAATLCYGFAINMAPPLQQKYGSLRLMAWVLTVASIMALPFGLLDMENSAASWSRLGAMLFLGVVGTGFAYAMMGELVGRVGGTRASFITYVIPGVALVLGVVFRDNHVAPLAVGGVILVLAGAALASRRTA